LKKLLAMFSLITTALIGREQIKDFYVSDGDTVAFKKRNKKIYIRLNGIDAPEKSQPMGQESKEHLKKLIDGKDLYLKKEGTDRYGRYLGVLYVGNKNINLQMVKDGHAWWYRQYSGKNSELEKAEQNAKKKKLGLWSKRSPQAPWEYRAEKRNGTSSSSSSKKPSKNSNTVANAFNPRSRVYYTTSGNKYHLDRNCKALKKSNNVRYTTRSKAEDRGLTLCSYESA